METPLSQPVRYPLCLSVAYDNFFNTLVDFIAVGPYRAHISSVMADSLKCPL